MFDRIILSLNYFLPKKWLTEFFGWFAKKQAGRLTKLVIDIFVWYYNVDMKESKNPNTASYLTFNDFFIRLFAEKKRPIHSNPNFIVYPADGIISQIGNIQGENIFQAKGYIYTLEGLLAGHDQMINYFYNGNFITTYLSPKNYHRVHMPCDGKLQEMIYVPGELYSVNKTAVKNIANLFSRNERIICLFETDIGPMAQILVGAMITGSIETVWHGTITPPRKGVIKKWTWLNHYKKNPVVLLKGQEMGRFQLGSTVINLFSSNKIKFFEDIKSDSKVYFGEPFANIL